MNVSTQQNVVVTTKEIQKEEGSVTFAKSDGRTTARPGYVLTYRITIRNPKSEDLTGIRIVDHVPPYLIPLSTNPEANADARTKTLTWTNQTISANAEVTFAFTARVAFDAPHGFLIQNIADINGPGVRGTVYDTTQVEAPQVAGAATAAPQASKTVPVTAKTGATPLQWIAEILALASAVATGGTLIARRIV